MTVWAAAVTRLTSSAVRPRSSAARAVRRRARERVRRSAAGVDVAGAGPGVGGLDDPVEEVHGARGEVAFGGQLGAAAQLVAEAADEVGESVGVAGVGDGAEQEVGEVGVLLHREEPGGLALVGVHLALVAEEFGVETEVAEVFVPAVVDLFPVHVEVRVELARVHQRVAEALHRAPPAACAGDAFGGAAHGGGLGDGQAVQAEPGSGPERIPGLGELAGVVGDLPAAPLADLADDDAFTGEGVLPLQGDVPAVVGEEELAQHAGAGAAEGVAVAGEHHREDQLEQDGLAAAVLQEEDARGGGAAGRADRLVLEELRLGGGGAGYGCADAAQIEDGVGVARTGRPDGVEADPGQLVHGGGLSSFGERGRSGRCGPGGVVGNGRSGQGRSGQVRSGRAGPRRRPAPCCRGRAVAAGWRSRR